MEQTNNDVKIAGMSGEALASNNEYCYMLSIDLEELADKNFDKVFSVQEVHESNNFVDFRVYNGIELTAKLPQGANTYSVQEFCNNIAERAEELTQGFSLEFVNGNQVARWVDEDGDQDNLNQPYSDACRFWSNLQDEVDGIDYTNVYDLSDGDNFSFVIENIGDQVKNLEEKTVDSILSVLYENYESDISTYIFTEFHEAAEKLLEWVKEEEFEEA